MLRYTKNENILPITFQSYQLFSLCYLQKKNLILGIRICCNVNTFKDSLFRLFFSFFYTVVVYPCKIKPIQTKRLRCALVRKSAVHIFQRTAASILDNLMHLCHPKDSVHLYHPELLKRPQLQTNITWHEGETYQHWCIIFLLGSIFIIKNLTYWSWCKQTNPIRFRFLKRISSAQNAFQLKNIIKIKKTICELLDFLHHFQECFSADEAISKSTDISWRKLFCNMMLSSGKGAMFWMKKSMCQHTDKLLL